MISNDIFKVLSITPFRLLLCFTFIQSQSYLAFAHANEFSDANELCDPVGGIEALGMESGKIDNAALRASSAHVLTYVGPQFARLNRDQNGGAWCPANPIDADNRHDEWIEVRLERPMVIMAIATQGRYGQGHGIEYMSHYHVEYAREADEKNAQWILWKNNQSISDIEGNEDTNHTQRHIFEPPIIGVRRIRVLPVSNHTRTVCLRFELYGCAYQGPIGYTLVQPSSVGQSNPWMLDNGYDGQIIVTNATNIYQFAGLGQLVDGHKVPNSTHKMMAKQHRSWVGWAGEEHAHDTQRIRIEFQFDQITNFTSIALDSMAIGTQPNIEVFIWISFSLANRTWNEHPIEAKYVLLSNHKREINVQLFHLIGAFVRIELRHNASQFLMDEVRFQCDPLDPVVLVQSTFLANLFEQLGSTSHALQEEMPNFGTRYVMGDDRFMPTNTDSHRNADMGLINWAKFSIILCICILGLVIVSLVASFVLRKLNRHKSSMVETHLNIGHDLKNEPMVLDAIKKNETDPEIASFMEISKTLQAPNMLSTSTLKLNSRFYASADFVQSSNVPKIYESPLGLPKMGRPKKFSLGGGTPSRSTQPPEVLSTPTEIGSEIYELANAPTFSYDIVNNNLNLLYYGIQIYSEADVRILSSLGKSRFGDVLVGCVQVSHQLRKATVRTITEPKLTAEFIETMKHRHQLAQTSDMFVQLFGIIHTSTYLASIVEHADYNLHFYLQQQTSSPVRYETLLYFMNEIATACAYLELSNQTHRDLAVRNILLEGDRLQVKLSDIGFFLPEFRSDYYRGTLPIRWMSREAIFLSKMTPKSDVYSFGVCCWEILTFAQCRPFAELTDDELLSAKEQVEVEEGDEDEDEDMLGPLPKPANCSIELYELLLACWRAQDAARPSFREICHFLQGEINLFK